MSRTGSEGLGAFAGVRKGVIDGVRDVGRYWAEEWSSLRRGLTAILLTAVTGMIAGLTLASAEETLERLPGLLLLIPAAIDMRGNIYGALASRLSTALHLGTYEIEFRRRGFMGRQLEATTLLTIGTSVIIAVVAWIFGAALGLEPIPVWKLVVIATLGGALASVFLVAVTVVLSRVAQLRDWNMDDVGAPSVTVIGDILTVPAILLAAMIVDHEPVALLLGVLLGLLGLWCLVGGWLHRDAVVRRIVRESLVALTAAAGVGVVAGTVLEVRIEQWIAAPVLLIMIPSFIANCGSLGGILSSRLASKLHLGLIEPSVQPSRLAWLDISVVFLFAVFAFSAIGTSAWAAATLFGHGAPPIGSVVSLTLTAGFLATLLLAGVAYATATASVHFGLDPDNEGIPIVTSAMDLLGLLALVGAVSLLW
ncbi:MAG: magnesium transporter [Gemmatimonadota bacterium]